MNFREQMIDQFAVIADQPNRPQDLGDPPTEYPVSDDIISMEYRQLALEKALEACKHNSPTAEELIKYAAEIEAYLKSGKLPEKQEDKA